MGRKVSDIWWIAESPTIIYIDWTRLELYQITHTIVISGGGVQGYAVLLSETQQISGLLEQGSKQGHKESVH